MSFVQFLAKSISWFFQKKIKAALFLLFFVLNLSFLTPAQASGSSLSLSNGGSHHIGDSFKVDVILEASSEKICAVKAYLSFPKNLLEVNSLEVGKIFTAETVKFYSNENGTISYVLGTTGCSQGDTILYTVNFKAKNAGSGQIKFSNTNVYSADDAGKSFPINVQLNNTEVNIPGGPNTQNTTDPSSQPQTGETSESTNPTITRTKNLTNNISKNEEKILKTPNLQEVKFSTNTQFDKTAKKSKGLSFSGLSEPNTKTTITIDKKIILSVTADKNGYWTINYDEWLPDGVHSFSAKSQNGDKFSNELVTFFTTDSEKEEANISAKLPENSKVNQGNEVVKKYNYKIIIPVIIGFILVLVSIIYAIYKKRRNNFQQKGQNDF